MSTIGTVFLSYASEDADAALQISRALRAAGIEVWFDKSELRGGDAWDRSIRQQIRSCRLFIAIISANTEARGEGYFRREWKLAVDRTHDMSERASFLVPVVIDDTRDATADVPDSFRAIQWTRLAGGVTSPSFVTRISEMLAAHSASLPARAMGLRPDHCTLSMPYPFLSAPVTGLRTSSSADLLNATAIGKAWAPDTTRAGTEALTCGTNSFD